MDLHFNRATTFTDWIVSSGALHEPFVVVDVGVQGGENPRWHRFGEHLVVHGFDAIEEVVDGLQHQNRGNPNRHYHWIAAGSKDEEREFYFNAIDPCSSSFYPQGTGRFAIERREQRRMVQVRRLDTLLKEGVIVRPDFLKTDVEGFEKDVLLGAQDVLRSVLGIETESNFGVSPTYPKSHFGTLQDILLERHLLVFDLNFNRVARASFQEALARKGLPLVSDQQSIGKLATLNVLFCRDLIDETDHPEHYTTPCEPVSVDQIIKIMSIYELYGLNDIAVDTAERFKDRLAGRLDVEMAILLLADPHCRAVSPALGKRSVLRAAYSALEQPGRALEHWTGLPVTASLRTLRKALARL
jgi:FkbM family methyltransferase